MRADDFGVNGVIGCKGVISAWSGGAFNSDENKMLVWGGGHNDYWGNELYAFSLMDGKWSRINDPSKVPDGEDANEYFNQDPLPDGTPVSRHTYDGVEYISHLNMLFGHGGARSPDGNGTKRTWFFDFSTNQWSMKSDGIGGYALATAYDPMSRKVIVKGSERMAIYDIETDIWKDVPRFGFPPLWPRYSSAGDKTGVIDSKRNLFWAIGSGNILVWDIEKEKMVTDDWVTFDGGEYDNEIDERYEGQRFMSGGGDVYNIAGPGMDYDSQTDSLVAWPNEGSPYILNLTTKTWSKGSAVGAPDNALNSGGTFGRWRYVEKYNVFVLVNSIQQNVFFYKFTSRCGPS